MPELDPEVLRDLCCVHDLRKAWTLRGQSLAFWEGLLLAKTDRPLLEEEAQRMMDASVPVNPTLHQKLTNLRMNSGTLAGDLRSLIDMLRIQGSPEALDMAVAFILVSPKGREAAGRWVQDLARAKNEAPSKVLAILSVVDGYRKALPVEAAPPPPPPMPRAIPVFAPPPPSDQPVTTTTTTFNTHNPTVLDIPVAPLPEIPEPPPAPKPKSDYELPAGVDPEVLEDIRRVEHCRKVFEATHQQIEVWEVFCLVMIDRDATKALVDQVLADKAAKNTDAFNQGALNLFDKLLAQRAKFGKDVRELRDFISKLQIGSFGKEMMEMALGFIVASPRGRERAMQWVKEPAAHKQEAGDRMESVISRTMKYQTALRMTE